MHKYIKEEPAEKIIIRMEKERLRKEREKNGLDPTNTDRDRDRARMNLTFGTSGTKKTFD